MAVYVRKSNGEVSPIMIQGYKGKDGETPEINIEAELVDSVEESSVIKDNNNFTLKVSKSEISERDKVDYMGNPHETLKETNDANVEYVLGEINTVNYEGQHITATDTFEKQVKSAILKGNTLVNLSTVKTSDFSGGRFIKIPLSQTLVNGKKYIVKIDEKNSTLPNGFSVRFRIGTAGETTGILSLDIPYTISMDGLNYLELFTKNADDTTNGYNATVDNIAILEYQDGMENWDIPYFEGMQSVQMPVLTTTGKNIIGECINPTERHKKYTSHLKPETRYTLNYKNSNGSVTSYGRVYLLNGETNSEITSYGYAHCLRFTTPTNVDDTTLLCIDSWNNELSVLLVEGESGVNISLDEILKEPYKSNILTTPQDVVLRKVGDVEDTLDLVTGELTQRIGEIVLDGSENWVIGRNTTHATNGQVLGFKIQIPNLYAPKWGGTTTNTIICDKLKVTSQFNQFTGEDFDSISQASQTEIQIMIKAVNGSINDTLIELRKMLSENPITVYYPIVDSVKTVDLKGQKVYSYKDTTHYDCSSANDSLVPTLNIDVPTNLSALASDQINTINAKAQLVATLELEVQRQEESLKSSLKATEELLLSTSSMLAGLSLLNEREDSDIVKLYKAMLKYGLKTIDEIPDAYKHLIE